MRVAEPASYDGVFEMAVANRPHEIARIVPIVLALPLVAYFQGYALGFAWLALCLAIEGARSVLVRKITKNDPAWRKVFVPVVVAMPWTWISFAILLWFANQEAARIAALCSLFGTLFYVAVNCHQDRRVLALLFAQPCFAVVCLIFVAFIHALPLWLAIVATLCGVVMLTVLGAGAARMYARRMQLLAARQALQDERDALDEKVRARTAELEEATKAAQAASEAKSRFLATMSHELRTPLNAIINYAEFLEEELSARGLANEGTDAQRIERQARQLLRIINDVLFVAQTSRADVRWEEADVGALAREAVDMLAEFAAQNGNRITAKVAPEIGTILTVPDRLRQAMVKLMANACKFTRDGIVSLSATIEGDQLAIRVMDTGVGIPPEQLARIFQPFTQVDNSDTRGVGGSGLGLVVIRGIAHMLGGDVGVESVVGQGSTFTLRVPVRRAPEMSEVA